MNQSILSKFFSLALLFLYLGSCDNTDRDAIGSKKSDVDPISAVDPIIVLCHGLGADPSSLDAIKERLNIAFPQASILLPHEEDTDKKAIAAQGNDVVCFLRNQGVVENRPIVLIGHSQGGLRAYWAAQELGRQVACVVTIGTPWEGTPLLKQKNLEKLFSLDSVLKPGSRASDSLKTLVYLLQSVKEKAWRGYKGNFSPNNLHGFSITDTRQSLFGVYDMRPGSTFLTAIKGKLRNNNIPILAIGGDASILSTTINTELRTYLPHLSLDTIFGGTPHDLLIPLSSQLADNLGIGENQKFQRNRIEGVIHFSAAKGGETRSSQVIKEAMEFINKQLAISHADRRH